MRQSGTAAAQGTDQLLPQTLYMAPLPSMHCCHHCSHGIHQRGCEKGLRGKWHASNATDADRAVAMPRTSAAASLYDADPGHHCADQSLNAVKYYKVVSLAHVSRWQAIDPTPSKSPSSFTAATTAAGAMAIHRRCRWYLLVLAPR